MNNEDGINQLRVMAQINPCLLEYYQDIAAVLYHDPTKEPVVLDWDYIFDEAEEMINFSKIEEQFNEMV